MDDEERFSRLRKKVMQAIKRELEYDSYSKSYEGTFEWTECYPSYFEEEEGRTSIHYRLTLHCYLLCPGRHYDWYGETKAEVLDQAEADIGSWIGDDEVDDEREYRNIAENLSLEELEFTVRTYNRLHKLGVRKLSDIVNIPESTFYNIDGFGKRSQEEVLGKLHWLGYTMKWEGLE